MVDRGEKREQRRNGRGQRRSRGCGAVCGGDRRGENRKCVCRDMEDEALGGEIVVGSFHLNLQSHFYGGNIQEQIAGGVEVEWSTTEQALYRGSGGCRSGNRKSPRKGSEETSEEP